MFSIFSVSTGSYLQSPLAPKLLKLPVSFLPATMAHYPEISAIDFSLRVENGRVFQNLVHVPNYAYQHTGNFDHYQLSSHDFVPCEGPGPARFVLRKGLAYSLWETVQMKVKYILAAAHNWNGQENTNPLPTTLHANKITEIGMPPPPFPDPMLLSANLFLADEDPEVIRYWVKLARNLPQPLCVDHEGQAQLSERCELHVGLAPLTLRYPPRRRPRRHQYRRHGRSLVPVYGQRLPPSQDSFALSGAGYVHVGHR